MDDIEVSESFVQEEEKNEFLDQDLFNMKTVRIAEGTFFRGS